MNGLSWGRGERERGRRGGGLHLLERIGRITAQICRHTDNSRKRARQRE